MKIKNGKIIFEEIPCWRCNGRGKVTRSTACKNLHQKIKRGKRCEICGAANQHKHFYIVNTTTEVCPACNGSGIEKESEQSHLIPELYNSLPVRIQLEGSFRKGGELLMGEGLVGGADDHGQMWRRYHEVLVLGKADADRIIKDKIQEKYSYAPLPAVKFIKDGRAATSLTVIIRETNYSVYPEFT